ncbi:pyridoxamine 5'-phosphate oxidase family protein [Paenibacillus sp. Y412MC10]|uniref:pyridoxamine 5'-phosphate oxidase family protein n=1 Tax=Geobacillus sp. (strain Y412MC10) TaxID=481743 RepID=UPI0011AB835D|nr:pyridoxamine 5'-phosphate oxidase family protein [Paenibacillus sp. Y412MC10]
MRRNEFEVTREEEIEAFLSEMSFGFLGTIGEDGHPRVTPINYVYHQDMFYMHGSRFGEKMDHLAANPAVSFSVAEEYAIIPSYFTDPLMACPATSYFKSVTASGRVEIVQDLEEKAAAFTLFMNKLQPEGGYAPIDAANPKYASRLRGVAVLRIVPDRITAKFKFGQNLTEDKREQVLQGLDARGRGKDRETMELIRSSACPHMQQTLALDPYSEEE